MLPRSGYLPVKDGYLHYWCATWRDRDSVHAAQAHPLPVQPRHRPRAAVAQRRPGQLVSHRPGASQAPRCPAHAAQLTELGQLITNDQSLVNMTNGVPNLLYNPWNWSLNHSVIFLEQPKGVGFSYCTAFPCINTDDSMAVDAYAFLTEFFGANAYPEYSKNEFYITVLAVPFQPALTRGRASRTPASTSRSSPSKS